MSMPISASEYEAVPVGSVPTTFWDQCLNPQSATQRKEVNDFLKSHGYVWKRSGSQWMLAKTWQPSEVLDLRHAIAELKSKQIKQRTV